MVLLNLRTLFERDILARTLLIKEARSRTIREVQRHYEIRKSLEIEAFEENSYYLQTQGQASERAESVGAENVGQLTRLQLSETPRRLP